MVHSPSAVAKTGPSAPWPRFPTTRSSAIDALRSADELERSRGQGAVARAYWKPIYKYARTRWRKTPEEAEEVTQEFFVRILSRDTFATFDASVARFRTFLRVCLDRFITDEERRRGAQKRGGGSTALALDADYAAAERELARAGAAVVDDPAAQFDAEWVRHVVTVAIDRLRADLSGKGKDEHLRAFELAHLAEADTNPSYSEMAEKLGITVTDVTNRLSYARRAFRRIALDLLREITASDEELRDEALAVFGIELTRR
jgi:RNA polymerase sigma factor (sigma-70 family)